MQNEKHNSIASSISEEDKSNKKKLCVKTNYGNEFNTHLLEQYKLYVEMADRVSSRRVQVSSFYVSILSAILAFLPIISNKDIFQGSQNIVLFTISILGLCLCFIWTININSYKQLNTLKFKVIHEMEACLPFACYEREWEILKSDNDRQYYLRLTVIEKNIPIIIAIPYFILLIYSLIKIIIIYQIY